MQGSEWAVLLIAGSLSLALVLGAVWLSAPASRAEGVVAGPRRGAVIAPAERLRAGSLYGRLALAFEPNRGQLDPRALFAARGPGYTLLLARRSLTLSVTGAGHRTASVLAVGMVGARADPPVVGQSPQPGHVNYLIGAYPARWHTGVPTFAEVRYLRAWPGIDVALHGVQGRLEYDFYLSPGADPRRIELSFTKRVREDHGGGLLIGAVLRQLAPRAYQLLRGQRRPVGSRYILDGDRVGLRLGRYNHRLPVVVDPTLVYSTYLGGSHDQASQGDGGAGIAVDAQGNAYITGDSSSADFPTRNALQSKNPIGTQTAYVTKLDPSGALVYSTYLGGSGGSDGNAIAVDSEGDAYVTGVAYSGDFPTKHAFQPHGLDDAFVSKLDPSGALVYSTYLGGTGGIDSGKGIAVDASGAAYITGQTESLDFPTKNAFQPQANGTANPFYESAAFVTKLDPSGALAYSTYLGGSGVGGCADPEQTGDYGNAIAVDPAGDAYITGETNSLDFPTKNASQPTDPAGPADLPGTVCSSAFVTKLDPSGALAYSTYLGGSSDGEGDGIAVDPTGDAYVTGWTDSDDFPTTHTIGPSGGLAFVAKLTPSGNPAYSTSIAGDTYGNAIAIDATGAAYIAGYTFDGLPIKRAFEPKNPAGSGNPTGFVIKLDPSGATLDYSSYLGGTGPDYGTGIAVDSTGAAYITGSTDSTDFPTRHALQPKNESIANGDGTGFVTKLSPFPAPPPPPRPRCPAPSGRLAGSSVGPLALELTRNRARALLPIYRVTYDDFDDFCLRGGFGIRAGYPSQKLLRELPPGLGARVRDRMVLMLSANGLYALHGVRHGTSVAGAAQRLRLGKPFHIGLNYWYITPGRRANGILKVRHGTVLEVGLADRALTSGRAAQRRFLKGFPRVGTSM
jgi:hypothetical protein